MRIESRKEGNVVLIVLAAVAILAIMEPPAEIYVFTCAPSDLQIEPNHKS